MYIFDTDTISNIVKKKPSAALIEKLRDVPAHLQYTTSITVAEIYYGASRSPYRQKILQAYEEKVFPHLSVLAFDQQSAVIFGNLKAALEGGGISKSEPDLRIASIALQHRFILVTGNTAHFSNIPALKVENWMT